LIIWKLEIILLQNVKIKYSLFNYGTKNLYANIGSYIPWVTKPAKFPILKRNNIPPYTLKFFPSNIFHCVSWSMNHFKKILFFDENIKFVKYMYDNVDDFYERIKQKNL